MAWTGCLSMVLHIKGKMDDIRLYQGELTATEVSSIYAETAPPVAVTIGSLYGPTALPQPVYHQVCLLTQLVRSRGELVPSEIIM